MKVMVTGANGQLGSDVVQRLAQLGEQAIGCDVNDFDITNRQACRDFILGSMPDAVIHCAAYTAVDNAEENEDLCAAVNVRGTENIAAACKEAGAKMMYISTDYVFSGEGDAAYETTDSAEPLSVYGRTKWHGELAVKQHAEHYFIVRISWVFGKNGANFVKTMLRLGQERDIVNVVNDQYGSPTYTYDLAKLICDIIKTDKYGIYHATNEGVCTWADFAREIFSLAGYATTVNPIPAKDYPAKAPRPQNSRLSKTSLVQEGFDVLPHWKDALERYLFDDLKI